MKQIRNRLIKNGVLLAGVYLTLFLIVFYSKELADGIKSGLNTAFGLVLPSMFLFLIFSNALMLSPAAAAAARPLRFAARKLFHIADHDAVILLLSLLGGYPVGAKLLADRVKRGELAPREAGRMLAFCVNCGPAFLISGVGSAVFGSLRFGLFLYLSQLAACLVVGIGSSLGRGRTPAREIASPSGVLPRKTETGANLLVSAVNDAAKAMAVICSFVVAFSALFPVLELWTQTLPESIGQLLRGLLEMTAGCQSLLQTGSGDPILMAALFTSFGGVCVLLQVCAMLRGSGVSMKPLLLWRIPYIAVSVFVTKALTALFPQIAETMTRSGELAPAVFSVSPAATAFLILLCIMLLFFCGKSDKIKEKKTLS